MPVEFWQSQRGAKFYDADVPRIAKALERIADNLEAQADVTPNADFEQGLFVWLEKFCALAGEHAFTEEGREAALAKLTALTQAQKKE